jgi:subtilisin family serine protease
MPIYIVRPKVTAAAGLSLALRSLSTASRASQLQEVSALRANDPGIKELSKAVKDCHGKVVHGGEKSTPVTGARIVEMSDKAAEQLRSQHPDLIVQRDQPISLIDPVRHQGTKKTAAKVDTWHLRAVEVEQARARGFTGSGDGVTVAVLDTGVDSHPEIKGRISNAVTFDVKTWKAKPQKPTKDTDGHGTHVTGLICGKTVGAAPGAKVFSGVMIPGGMGMLSDFILAIEWAGQQPEVQILNMSAGIPGWEPGMQAVVADLLRIGVLPVIAVGNEGRNHSRSPGNYVDVVSVGATDKNNRVSSFSGGGRRRSADGHEYVIPDLVAPGEGVFSCVSSGGYEAWDGTSMATPIVSGIAALILEKYASTMRVSDMFEALFESCFDLGVAAERQGYGLLKLPSTVTSAARRKAKKRPAKNKAAKKKGRKKKRAAKK